MPMPYTEAIDVDYCRNECPCKELCQLVTPPFHSSSDAKIGRSIGMAALGQ